MRDGIVHEESYLGHRPRILFVLKEPNDLEGGGWDLRNFVETGARSRTWDNLARWVAGIRRLPEETAWQEVAILTADRIKSLLHSIAAMNVKKSPGGGVAERAKIISIAREDRDFLLEQFNIYAADLVVSCGSPVRELVEELLLDAAHGSWKSTSRGVWFKEFRPSRFAVDYAHPQVRTWGHLLFYGLVDAIREIAKPAARCRTWRPDRSARSANLSEEREK